MDNELEVKRDVLIDMMNDYCVLYANYIDAKGLTLDNSEDPDVAKYAELIRLERDSYGIETIEEYESAKEKFNAIKEYYKKINTVLS